MRFQSAKARSVLRAAECHVDEETGIVRIPPHVVSWAVQQLEREVLLAGRDPLRDALLDGSRTYATVAGICPYVADLETGAYREPSLDDLAKLTMLADALDGFGIVWYSVSPTADTAAKMTDLAAAACLLSNTGKHVMAQVVRPAEVPFAREIVRICAGGSSERPILSVIYCPVAPLQHEGPAIEAAMELALHRIPIDIFSLGLAGATAPVTLAGTILQTNCDVLSAVVLLQLVSPGCPLIYSANAGIIDMTTSRFAVSTPETVLMNLAQIELAHSYDMPCLSVGYVPDSGELGFRAGLEDMAFALPTRMARPDIMTGLGTLEAGQAVSFQKMLLDDEVVRYLDRVMAGITMDEEHLLLQSIVEAGAGGHYLGQKETRRRVRQEHWMPRLLRRTSYNERQQGDPDEIARATAAVSEVLSGHQPMELPAGAVERIAGVLTEAQRSLPDC